MEKLKKGEKGEKTESITSKGFYRYPQPSDYVCLKQYIFLRSGSEKHLLLRFENDTKRTLDCIELELTELNIDGKVIKQTKIKSGKISALAGAAFSFPKRITVSKNCVDFKIRVTRAVSENYVYFVKSGAVRCRYEKCERDANYGQYSSRGYSKKSVGLSSSSCIGVFLPIFVLFIVIVGAAYSALTIYTDFRLRQIPEFVFDFLSDIFSWIFRKR